jgi:hypothetical protein
MSSDASIVPVPFPYGVADAAGTAGYLADGAGGIRAVDLRDGRTRWRTQAAERPLLVRDDRLVALKRLKPNALEVVLLSASDGTLTLKTEPIMLPEWVVTGIVDTDRFALRPRVDETGQLEIQWTARAVYAGGAPPPRKVLREAERVGSGIIRVNLTTGQVDATADATATPSRASLAAPSAPAKPSGAPPDALQAHVVADCVYSIIDTGSSRLALRASDPDTGHTIWEAPLEVGTTKPPARRL